MRWPDECSVHLSFWEIREFGPEWVEPSQTNDFKIDTCHFLARHSALLGQGKDWLAQGKKKKIYITKLDQVKELVAWSPGWAAL